MDLRTFIGHRKKDICVRASEQDRTGAGVALVVCCFAVFVFASTEILSLFHGITQTNIRILWLFLFLTVLAAGFFFVRKKIFPHFDFSPARCFLCIVAAGWLFYLGYLALRTVPSNWDSMTYHMARVANWIQNQSVDYYPTNIQRQLYSPVFSEYVILHLCLLFGNDVTANLVQYTSFLLILYFLWDILKKTGFSDRAAFFADVLFATMPMAIAESMTTQVDLVGCMWLLLFIDLVIELVSLEQLHILSVHLRIVLACAVAIAFGYLTKSNVCFLMIPFLAWLLIRCIGRRDDVKVLCFYTIFAAAVILLFVAPTFIRNYNYTGDILASSYMSGILVGTVKPHYLLVNIYKNFALLAATDSTKELITSFGQSFAGLMGIDINAPEISVTGGFSENLHVSYHHDTANNPFVAWFFLAAVIVLLILFILKKEIKNKVFIGVCLITVVAGLSSLRYQVWGSRLLTSACAVMCLISATALDSINALVLKDKVKNVITLILCVVAVAFSIPALSFNAQYARAYNESKNRFQMYFVNRNLYEQYVGVCDYVDTLHLSKIGMLLGTDTFEYPLWVRLKNENTDLIQVVPGRETEIPECIVAIFQNMPVGCEYAYAGELYTCVYNYAGDPGFAVLLLSTD